MKNLIIAATVARLSLDELMDEFTTLDLVSVRTQENLYDLSDGRKDNIY